MTTAEKAKRAREALLNIDVRRRVLSCPVPFDQVRKKVFPNMRKSQAYRWADGTIDFRARTVGRLSTWLLGIGY